MDFNFKFPPNYPNAREFNPQSIHGRLSRLFTVKDMAKDAIAIQSIIGIRIRNVVVSNHAVSRDLLAYRAFQGNETFLPLNKMKYRIIPEDLKNKL